MCKDLHTILRRFATQQLASNRFRGSLTQWGILLDQRLAWFHDEKQLIGFLSDLILPYCIDDSSEEWENVSKLHANRVQLWKEGRLFLHEFQHLTDRLLEAHGRRLLWIGTLKDLCKSGEELPCQVRWEFREGHNLVGGMEPIRSNHMKAFKEALQKGSWASIAHP